MSFKGFRLVLLITIQSLSVGLGYGQVSLKGMVTGAGRAVVPFANVRLEPDGHYTTSNEAGYFELKKLYSGTYYITITAVGHQVYHQTVLVGKEGDSEMMQFEMVAAEELLETVKITGARENPDQVLSASQAAQVVLEISRAQIEAMGSRRLDEVLKEQTGMAVVNDVGSGNRSVGIQIQGFSSEYITILLNGQPMGGRHGGNFDLSRISAHDIERIEVIKGASCSFYGSEALGGTVNIVTRQNVQAPTLSGAVRYGSFATKDVNVSGETPFASGNGFAHLGVNFYQTDGFNVNPYLKDGKTAPPYTNGELNGRTRWQLSPTGFLNASIRWANRYSVMDRNYGAMPTSDKLQERDFNGMVSWDQYIGDDQRLLFRYYTTVYTSRQNVRLLQNDHVLQRNDFSDRLHKLEIQHRFSPFSKEVQVSSGVGGELQANISDVTGTGGNMVNYFAFSQVNWDASDRLSLVGGVRYDGNTVYGGRLNPTLGVNYGFGKWLSIHTSLGTGFKSPTYRQMFQRFTNMSQGYTVLGAHNLSGVLEDMKDAGVIQQIWPIADQVKELKAETATSVNVQFGSKPLPQLDFSFNLFYNDIRNLILSQQIGIKQNGAQIFSWFNIASTYSRGIETSATWRVIPGISVTAGYQMLDMKDRGVLDSIRTGTGGFAWVRSDQGVRSAVVSDYYGLPNRSRHSGSGQLNFYHKRWDTHASFRAQFRGKYGFLDIDNNGYIDRYDVFVKGYALLNITLQKAIWRKQVTIQLSADNLLNYTDYLMPSQPGRMIMAGVQYRFVNSQTIGTSPDRR